MDDEARDFYLMDRTLNEGIPEGSEIIWSRPIGDILEAIVRDAQGRAIYYVVSGAGMEERDVSEHIFFRWNRLTEEYEITSEPPPPPPPEGKRELDRD